MYIKGFGVLTWSDPSLALWVKYSSFNHIEYAVLKKMGVFYSTYDYVFRERAVQLLIINRALIGHSHETMRQYAS